MRKNSKLWQAFLGVGIAALTVPAFVQGQTSGSGSSATDSGTHSGSIHPGSGGMGTGGGSGTMGSSEMIGSRAMTDQATTEADRSLNQSIRQGLNSDSSLSSSAKNVHFSTTNGVVTLYGTVATEMEKQSIEDKVEHMTGVKEVRNELQMAPSTSGMSGSSGSSASR
jgi:osmotically-inducible protein OsmY